MLDKDSILKRRGEDLYDRGGEKIGGIEEVYLDAETNEPAWAVVNTGLLGTKKTFVPLRGATDADGVLSVPFYKSAVKDAPKIDHDGQLTRNEEAELHRHYGIG
jgi:PRC-barrel domain